MLSGLFKVIQHFGQQLLGLTLRVNPRLWYWALVSGCEMAIWSPSRRGEFSPFKQTITRTSNIDANEICKGCDACV